MRFTIDEQFLTDCFAEIVGTPSPVGYYVQLNPVLERYAARFGHTVTYDNKSTAYITPEGVSEYVVMDIGLIGPDYDGNEYKVSICAKDASAPYDYELTNRLIGYAEKAGCDYAVDVFYRYGTDGNAAVRAGNNLRAAAFGMAVYCSHGMERTHITGLRNTVNLLLAYVLDI